MLKLSSVNFNTCKIILNEMNGNFLLSIWNCEDDFWGAKRPKSHLALNTDVFVGGEAVVGVERVAACADVD